MSRPLFTPGDWILAAGILVIGLLTWFYLAIISIPAI